MHQAVQSQNLTLTMILMALLGILILMALLGILIGAGPSLGHHPRIHQLLPMTWPSPMAIVRVRAPGVADPESQAEALPMTRPNLMEPPFVVIWLLSFVAPWNPLNGDFCRHGYCDIIWTVSVIIVWYSLVSWLFVWTIVDNLSNKPIEIFYFVYNAYISNL